MDHSEAVHQMVAEKYLLDELPPDLRDAFEEHLFDCPECAFDIRAGAAFVDEAKIQLPALAAAPEESSSEGSWVIAKGRKASRPWSSWWRPLFVSPAFAAPVFATLLAIVGYQNFVTYPALRAVASEPHLLPSIALHAGTRGGASTVVEANRKQGVVLAVEVPEQTGYASYTVDLYDPQGKLAWTHNITAAAIGAQDDSLSLVIPGSGLQGGSYALAISGVATTGERSEIERHTFDIHLND